MLLAPSVRGKGILKLGPGRYVVFSSNAHSEHLLPPLFGEETLLKLAALLKN